MFDHVVGKAAALAAGQWGLLTAAQAASRGLSRMHLTRMVRAGLLERITHGVYATPGAQAHPHVSIRASWLALDPAQLAEERLHDLTSAGVVSHASAAQLLELGDLVADEHEFTTAHRHQTRRAGVRVRRADLRKDEVTLVEGLPVTTAARTVADLLRTGHELEHVAAVVGDALRRDLTDGPTLEAALSPVARRHGARSGAELLNTLLDLAGMGLEDLGRHLNSPQFHDLVQAMSRMRLSPELSASLERWGRQMEAATRQLKSTTDVVQVAKSVQAAVDSLSTSARRARQKLPEPLDPTLLRSITDSVSRMQQLSTPQVRPNPGAKHQSAEVHPLEEGQEST